MQKIEMTSKELLLEQFTVSYDRNGWFVALKNALVNLTAEQAAWKPEGADNSIWEILAHLNYYNRAYLERFKGVDYQYTKSSNDETFAGGENDSEEAWQAEVAEFGVIMDGWREQLEAAPEEKFAELYQPKNESAWGSYITQINMHNAHHGGQIVILRKLQGSWDSAKGVS
jgi:uncharacterized damage-inducible protein DinB